MSMPLRTANAAMTTTRRFVRKISPLLLFCREAFIYGFDEQVSGPGTGIRSPSRPKRFRRVRTFHLVECHTALDHVVDDVANERDHVTVLHQVGLIGHAAVRRNQVGAA